MLSFHFNMILNIQPLFLYWLVVGTQFLEGYHLLDYHLSFMLTPVSMILFKFYSFIRSMHSPFFIILLSNILYYSFIVFTQVVGVYHHLDCRLIFVLMSFCLCVIVISPSFNHSLNSFYHCIEHSLTSGKLSSSSSMDTLSS